MLIKIKELINKDNIKKILILGLLIFAVVFMIVFMVRKFNTDGMEQTKGAKVYYRTYTKENGWSKWSKNGLTSGNKNDDILNIEVKVKPKKQGSVTYNVYQKKWSGNTKKFQDQKIKGIKFGLAGKMYRKYDICYRTYNEKNDWLEWSCDGEISGNKDKNIKALEIKIIPKNVIKNDYLRGYNSTANNANVGF